MVLNLGVSGELHGCSGGCNGNVESRWAVFRLRKNSLISDSCVGWDRSGSEMGNRYLGLGSLRFRMAVVILVSW